MADATRAAADPVDAESAEWLRALFRGESRFTTWAYKFVIFEVSDKIGRHFWQNPGVRLDAGDWDQLPDRFGFEPAGQRYPGIAAHLHACGPCGEDFDGLLAALRDEPP